MRLLLSCTIAFVLATSLAAHAERGYVAFEQRLSAEQFRATGLDQLTPRSCNS